MRGCHFTNRSIFFCNSSQTVILTIAAAVKYCAYSYSTWTLFTVWNSLRRVDRFLRVFFCGLYAPRALRNRRTCSEEARRRASSGFTWLLRLQWFNVTCVSSHLYMSRPAFLRSLIFRQMTSALATEPHLQHIQTYIYSHARARQHANAAHAPLTVRRARPRGWAQTHMAAAGLRSLFKQRGALLGK